MHQVRRRVIEPDGLAALRVHDRIDIFARRRFADQLRQQPALAGERPELLAVHYARAEDLRAAIDHWLLDRGYAGTSSLALVGNRYELRERVGKGATGIVYRAEDETLRTDIAIKIFRKQYAGNEEALERERRAVHVQVETMRRALPAATAAPLEELLERADELAAAEFIVGNLADKAG